MLSIQSLTVSPGWRKRPRPMPTPAGVPVRIKSPGWSVIRVERWAICSAVVKIISLVFEPCISSSPIQSFMASFWGSGISLAGVIHGPRGQAPSKHFWLSQSSLNGEASATCGQRIASRAERSLAIL